MTADNNTCHRIKKFCWRSDPKSPGLLFWVFYFRRTEFSTDGAVTRIELLTWIQIEISSSNNDLLSVQPKVGECHSIQKNLKDQNKCAILCAVREELTDSCRVWLTKLSSKNVFLEMKFILCSCRQGRLSSVFRQGRLALRANFWFILCSFRQGRLALRANFWFILCSVQAGKI